MDGFNVHGDFIMQEGFGNVGKIVNQGESTTGTRHRGRRSPDGTLAADVILVTVNDTETRAVRIELERLGLDGRHALGDVNSYVLYGPIGGAVVAHVRSGMGSVGQRASALTVADAIRELRATAVIGVGVAFGIDEAAQPIGQLLLSERLTSYEIAKIATGPSGRPLTLERGRSTECSARLMGRFLASRLITDRNIDVRVGELLSGEKLVDNVEFKRALINRFPEAIGGEMEGAGLQAASGRENVEWIVAKAVCDYASQKSVDQEQRQVAAAANAARVVSSVLELGGLVRKR